jgi:hypothetical protein
MIPLLLSLSAAGLNLEWTGPAECPPASAIVREVKGLVGPSLDELELKATAAVETDPWRAELRVFSRVGASARTLRGESCEALAEAAAVIVALAAAEVNRTPESSPRRAPMRAGITLRPVRVRWPWLPAPLVETGVVVGASPGPTLQAQLGASVLRLPWRAELGAWFRVPRSVPGLEEAEILGVGGWLRACRVLWSAPAWAADLCAVGELGSFNVAGVEDGDALWFAGGPGLALWRRIGPLELRLGFEGLAHRVRPEIFGVQDGVPGEDPIYQPARASFRAFLGFGRRFR